MKSRNRIHLLLALLATTSAASAQDAKKAAAPATLPAAAPSHAATAADAAPAALMETISLHVTGLTKENLGKVREALTSLGAQRYVCSVCKHEQATPGKCPLCQKELQGLKWKALTNLTLAPESSSITFTPATGGKVRLSEIERSLTRDSIHVDESRLMLPGKATLILEDGVADNAPAVEKALKDAKLFDDVHVRFDAVLHELEIDVRAGASAPARSAVAKALEGAGTKARLYDVIWGQPPQKT